MVYYKLVKVTINAPNLAKVIINVVGCYYRVAESIANDQGLLFTSKF